MADEKVDFGYQQVDADAKAGLVGQVFDSVAGKYDLMNDLMSFGIHRVWKRQALEKLMVRSGHNVLDVASGTGDLTLLLRKRWGDQIKLVMTDINASMLDVGRDRMLDAGAVDIPVLQADAECLPFQDSSFDRIIIGFGLRNVTDKQAALNSMARLLKPGGCLVVLEFSQPVIPLLAKVYDHYSFTCLPWIGKVVVKDSESYKYLAESIRKHPDQETLRNMFAQAGLEDCAYKNLTGGIVALHWGYKY